VQPDHAAKAMADCPDRRAKSRKGAAPVVRWASKVGNTERSSIMKARIEQRDLTPGGLRAMLGLEKYLATCGLEKKLLDLIYLRVSQMNGCAYCLDMHWKDLRAEGETEQRMYSLDAWRETPYYSERERAALAWAEAVTRVALSAGTRTTRTPASAMSVDTLAPGALPHAADLVALRRG
jgi:AhpD family alkylhydroperoxidase